MEGGNPYTYVTNNPLKYTDPSGYTKVARDYAGENMYWMMQSMTGRVMEMSYGLTSFGGGGFGGSGAGINGTGLNGVYFQLFYTCTEKTA
jgi:hypothetical protein